MIGRRNRRTTKSLRRKIQTSRESARALARKYGLNRATVAKWKMRDFVEDVPCGPKPAGPRTVSVEDEAMIVEFRRFTLLPLDDCHYALKQVIPCLTRSSLQRCLKRNGISCLPPFARRMRVSRSGPNHLGAFFVRVYGLTTDDGLACYYTAIDPLSKLVFSRVRWQISEALLCDFLEELTVLSPYPIRSVTTILEGLAVPTKALDALCKAHGIRRERAEPDVGGWYRSTSEPGTLHFRSRYATRQGIAENLQKNLANYTFKIRLKGLEGQTPFEHLLTLWKHYPDTFKWDPRRLSQTLSTLGLER